LIGVLETNVSDSKAKPGKYISVFHAKEKQLKEIA